MCRRLFAAAALAALLTPAMAIADERQPDPEKANDTCIYGSQVLGAITRDDQIAACDVAAASGEFSGEDLAWIYNSRALRRAAGRQFDEAFADFALAIAAKPDLAFLYSNRAQV